MRNKKRNIICTISIVVVLLTTIAVAYGNETIEKIIGFVADEYSISNTTTNDTNTQTTGTSSSKFEQMLAVMNETIENAEEFNSLIYDYKYIEKVYKAPQSELDYIADRVIEGCNMSDILDIYYFWRDTNEDINIIKQIYDLKANYIMPRTGEAVDYWIEKAMNEINESKYGVLSEEEVENYLEQGITVEDIETANVLCRKGIYTIQQILDKKLSGQTLVEITNEIENGGYDVEIYASLAGDDEENGKSAEEIVDENILISRELSEITGEEPKVFLEKAADGEDLSELLSEKDALIESELLAELENENILKSMSSVSENE